jgi:hypothetical protein
MSCFRPRSPKLRISVNHRVSHLFASAANRIVRFVTMRGRLRFIEHDKSYIVNCQCVYLVGINGPFPLPLVHRRRRRTFRGWWLWLDSIDHAIEPCSRCLSVLQEVHALRITSHQSRITSHAFPSSHFPLARDLRPGAPPHRGHCYWPAPDIVIKRDRRESRRAEQRIHQRVILRPQPRDFLFEHAYVPASQSQRCAMN